MQPVSEPLYLTTSFQRKTELHPDRGYYSYSRTTNPNFETLQRRLMGLYPGSEDALLFPSGMSAISTLLQEYSCNGAVFIVGDEMYCDTYRTLNFLKGKYENLIYHAVDVRDTERIKELTLEYKNRIKMFFFESVSNPSGYVPDFEEIRKCRLRATQSKFVIDNSWMSGVLFNPLEHGADAVIDSISKYIGGGKVIMGSLVGKLHTLKKVRQYTKVFGIRVSQYDAWTVSEMILTLPHRMLYLSQITPEIANFLSQHPKISKIFYPQLSNHPTHDRFEKYFTKGSPGIIYFQIPVKKEEAIRFGDRSDIILYATSYGKPDTMIDPYPYEDENGTWVRLSIGWASNKDVIINELARMLNNIGEKSEN